MMTPTDQLQSPLLTLPPEIGNHSYLLALTSNKPIKITPHGTAVRHKLLQTCRQIQSEATTMIFEDNTFQISGNTQALQAGSTWLDSVNAPIKGVIIKGDMKARGFGFAQGTGSAASRDARSLIAALDRAVDRGVLEVKGVTTEIVMQGGRSLIDYQLYNATVSKMVLKWVGDRT